LRSASSGTICAWTRRALFAPYSFASATIVFEHAFDTDAMAAIAAEKVPGWPKTGDVVEVWINLPIDNLDRPGRLQHHPPKEGEFVIAQDRKVDRRSVGVAPNG